MRRLFVIILGLFAITALAQSQQPVELKWKIGKGEKLSYYTVMSEIDTSLMEISFGGIFKIFEDSTRNGVKESRELFKEYKEAFQNNRYVTTLTNKGSGIVDIVMNSEPGEKVGSGSADSKEAELLQMMQSMNKGVVLRGSVYEAGGIHSFWVKSNQKNLIALLFELPAKPVKIGDVWSLDIDLIANDQNFTCDSAYKVNEVTLADIKKTNGETIAVVRYNIAEYVKGTFYTPALFGNGGGAKETMMKFVHQGMAEFSVEKGRWIAYEAIMSLDAEGVMTARQKTRFALISE